MLQDKMGKQLPNRLKEVVYTLSPFETTVMSGLWKDLPQKLHRKVSEVHTETLLLMIKTTSSLAMLQSLKVRMFKFDAKQKHSKKDRAWHCIKMHVSI